MLLDEIDFAGLTEITDPDRWGAGTERDRRIFKNGNRHFKIWGPNYLSKTMAAKGDTFVMVHGLKRLHGFETGLFSDDICRAFVEDIHDRDGIVRGYVTASGPHPADLPDAFCDRVFEASLRSGWVFSDLKPGNVISVDGELSLIDFDTHLSALADMDKDFETRSGCLRAHIPVRFRSRITEYLSGRPGTAS